MTLRYFYSKTTSKQSQRDTTLVSTRLHSSHNATQLWCQHDFKAVTTRHNFGVNTIPTFSQSIRQLAQCKETKGLRTDTIELEGSQWWLLSCLHCVMCIYREYLWGFLWHTQLWCSNIPCPEDLRKKWQKTLNYISILILSSTKHNLGLFICINKCVNHTKYGKLTYLLTINEQHSLDCLDDFVFKKALSFAFCILNKNNCWVHLEIRY